MATKEPDHDNPLEQKGEGAEDTFGLPDVEYKPLDRSAAPGESEPAQEPEAAAPANPYTYPREERSKAPVVIGIIIFLVLIAAAFLIYQYVYVPQAEKARKEEADRKAAEAQKAEDARLAKIREEEERKRREAEAAAAAAAKPTTGTIETLTERTGRYYVVISSAVDGDLSMDYARKLAAAGVSTQIIPPFGKWKFNRVALSDHPDFASAQAEADAKKAEYGNEVWVIRY